MILKSIDRIGSLTLSLGGSALLSKSAWTEIRSRYPLHGLETFERSRLQPGKMLLPSAQAGKP